MFAGPRVRLRGDKLASPLNPPLVTRQRAAGNVDGESDGCPGQHGLALWLVRDGRKPCHVRLNGLHRRIVGDVRSNERGRVSFPLEPTTNPKSPPLHPTPTVNPYSVFLFKTNNLHDTH